MDSLTDLEERVSEYMHSDEVQAALLADNDEFLDKPLPEALRPTNELLLDTASIANRARSELERIPDRWKIEYLEYIIDVFADEFYKPWWRRLCSGFPIGERVEPKK